MEKEKEPILDYIDLEFFFRRLKEGRGGEINPEQAETSSKEVEQHSNK